MKMPTVLCGGHVVTQMVGDDEVRLAFPTGVIHYLKRVRDEPWPVFITRVTRFAERTMYT